MLYGHLRNTLLYVVLYVLYGTLNSFARRGGRGKVAKLDKRRRQSYWLENVCKTPRELS